MVLALGQEAWSMKINHYEDIMGIFNTVYHGNKNEIQQAFSDLINNEYYSADAALFKIFGDKVSLFRADKNNPENSEPKGKIEKNNGEIRKYTATIDC